MSDIPAPPNVGSKVRHIIFGHGIVKRIEETGLGTAVHIKFDQYGTKPLLWDFAHSKITVMP